MATFRYSPGDRPLVGYTIEYALGKGGFGEVYFARSDARREVALKAILEHEEVELRGAKNCMNVKSFRLLAIHDIKRADDGVVWIVMEYVRGPSLQDIITESPDGLEPEQAVYLLRELALGLSDLHNAGIVHRDLKPSNVFFDGGRVKIGDYSLSKTISSNEQSQHTMTVGSVHYMAPEISLGRYDKTVDIYALGIILFEVLTGRPPHTGETVGEVLMKHLHADVDVGPVDSRFRAVIQRAANRDPSNRFQTAEEFAKFAMESVNTSSIADSFSPTTLSLIGQRAREQRHLAIVEDHDKRSNTNGKESFNETKTRGIELRILYAATLTILATLLQMFFSNRGGLGPFDGMLFALGLFGTTMIPAYRLLRWPNHDEKLGRSWTEIVLRPATALLAAGFLFLYSTLVTPLEVEGVAITCLSCLLALTVVDWRLHVTRERDTTIHWYPTITSGAVAAMLCILVQMPEWLVFATASTIGLALSLQAIAPCSISPKKRGCRRRLVPAVAPLSPHEA